MTESKSFIFFDRNTDFNGEIKASHIVLEGKVKGTIHAERDLCLKKGALLEGEVHTKNFFAEKGSVYHGELHIENSNGQSQSLEKAKTPSNGQAAPVVNRTSASSA